MRNCMNIETKRNKKDYIKRRMKEKTDTTCLGKVLLVLLIIILSPRLCLKKTKESP